MELTTIQKNGHTIAVITNGEPLLKDSASALELVMNALYETGAQGIVLAKEAIAEDFFILSTGLAGEILQKFMNYHVKFAVYGDFSRYTSKPLRDFIYESNHGTDVFFMDTKDHAVQRLLEALGNQG